LAIILLSYCDKEDFVKYYAFSGGAVGPNRHAKTAGGDSSFPTELLEREDVAIVEPMRLSAVIAGHHRLARPGISLSPFTRVSRDRNPAPGVTAHHPEVEFTRDRRSELLHVGGFSHNVPLPDLPMNLSLSHDE
jgi:hypothetical protein